MELTKKLMYDLVPVKNQVLLKPLADTSKLRYGNMELHAPVSLADGKVYDERKQAPVMCEVISAPKKLIYGKRWNLVTSEFTRTFLPSEIKRLHDSNLENKETITEWKKVPVPLSMPWKTEMKLHRGDVVWVSANALMMAGSLNNILYADGEKYYLIRYEDIYLKKSGESVEMLNGWVLAEAVKHTEEYIEMAKSAGIEVVDLSEAPDKFVKIKYIGSPVKEYIDGIRKDCDEFKEGDVVWLKWSNNRRLESDGMKFFSPDEELIVTRRCNMIAILTT